MDTCGLIKKTYKDFISLWFFFKKGQKAFLFYFSFFMCFSFFYCYAQEEEQNQAYWPRAAYDTRHSGRSPYLGPANPVEKKWEFRFIEPTGEGHRVANCPITIDGDGTIYVGTWGYWIDNTDDRAHGKLFAVNPDGSQKWVYDPGGLSQHYVGTLEGAPAITNEGIYFGRGDGILYKLDKKGNLADTFYTAENTNGRGQIIAAPAVSSDNKIYIGTIDYSLWGGYGLNLFYSLTDNVSTGLEEDWRYGRYGTEKTFYEAIWAAPSLDSKGNVYFAVGEQYHSLNRQTGEKNWQLYYSTYHYNHPELPDSLGTCFGGVISDDEETIYFLHGKQYNGVDLEGTAILALYTDPDKEERVKWVYVVPEDTISAALSAEGILYVGAGNTRNNPTQKGRLFALKDCQTYAEPHWLNEVEFDSQAGSPRIDGNGIIYVKTRGSIDMRTGAVKVSPKIFAFQEEKDTDGNIKAKKLWEYEPPVVQYQDGKYYGEEIWWSNLVIGKDKTLYFATAVCDKDCSDQNNRVPALYALGEAETEEPISLPIVTITSPVEDTLINVNQLQIIYQVEGDEISSENVYLDSQRINISSGSTLTSLSDGQRTLKIEAENSAGVASDEISFIVDTVSPEINITSHKDGDYVNKKDISVTVYVFDETSKIKGVLINETAANLLGEEGYFKADLTLEEGQNRISVKAFDEAGNEGSKEISVFCDTTAPSAPVINFLITPTKEPLQTIQGIVSQDTEAVLVKVNENTTIEATLTQPIGDNNKTWFCQIELSEGQNTISVTAKDSLGNESNPVIASIFLDTQGPVIEFAYPEGDIVEDDAPSVIIKIGVEVVDALAVKSVTINGVTADNNISDNPNIFGVCCITLVEGDNSIEVIAIDSLGNITTAEKTIHYTNIDQTPPYAPIDLNSPKQTQESITLSWSMPSSPAGDDDTIFSYNVYKLASLEADSAELLTAESIEEISFEHTGLEPNTLYYYAVTAIDDSGNEVSYLKY